MDIDIMIRDAIGKRLILRLHYRSFSEPEMIVEPHAYGLRNGIPTVLAWDRAVSEWDWNTGWRWLEVDQMLNPGFSGVAFSGAQHGYTRDSRQIETIYARI